MKENFIRNLITQNGKSTVFKVDEILMPTGTFAVRDYMEHPGAVAILAKNKDRFILVKQYRYPVKKITLEIPAGKLEKGEDLFLSAKRELEEETGYCPGNLRHFLSFNPTGAFSTEVIHLFYADRFRVKPPNPDEDENLEVLQIPERKIMEYIKKGKISDSKTIIAFLYYFRFIKLF